MEVKIDTEQKGRVSSYLLEHHQHCTECDMDSTEILNDLFTLEEVMSCIDAMPNGKAPSPDVIAIELFKCDVSFFAPLLLELYNTTLKSGDYPTAWCDAIICPIHKGGPRTDENNYRGISLLSVVWKIFTKVCNNRLVSWATVKNKYNEAQAGYRKGFSTRDHLFTLQTITQKYLSKTGGRCYVLHCICGYV